MEDIIYAIFGIAIFYVLGHFFVIQFKKNWEDRSNYEQALTVTSIIIVLLLIFGSTY